jgi:thiamine biosynthesis lipoprotein
VGVRDPDAAPDEGSSVARVALTGGSVVTSGLYERQFEANGRRWWHILDPRTGYPVESDLVSATIVSDASLDGDGYTKPLFMLGLEGALAFLEERGLDGLLIDDKGAIHTTVDSAFEVL